MLLFLNKSINFVVKCTIMTAAAPNKLSNLQLELLNIYANGITDEQLIDIKSLLAKYFAEQIKTRTTQIWKDKKYSEETMEQWLNEENQ
jgi:arsenate reductase-like glutaredoxin family protein